MAFMVPEYTKGQFYEAENEYGEGFLIPADVIGPDPDLSDFRDYIEGAPASYDLVSGWFARLSAPGYMDATEWSGPFKTKKEAEEFIEDTYEVDPKTGDALEDNPRRRAKTKKRRKKAAKKRGKKAAKRKRNPVSVRSLVAKALK